jgi:hypothetical protein
MGCQYTIAVDDSVPSVNKVNQSRVDELFVNSPSMMSSLSITNVTLHGEVLGLVQNVN